MANRIYGCDQIRGNTSSKFSVNDAALVVATPGKIFARA